MPSNSAAAIRLTSPSLKRLYTLTNFISRMPSSSSERRIRPSPPGEPRDAYYELVVELGKLSCFGFVTDCRCCGEDNDQAIVTEHGKCIAPLHQLLRLLTALCDDLHRELVGRPPDVQLATTRTHSSDNTLSLGAFGLSRWHELQGRGVSVVGVELRHRHFDLDSALALYYAFVHELVCHAFQGIENVSSRQPSQPCCSWSEGWMDTFTYQLSLYWLHGIESVSEPNTMHAIGLAADVLGDEGLRRRARHRLKQPVLSTEPDDESREMLRDAELWIDNTDWLISLEPLVAPRGFSKAVMELPLEPL